MSNASSYRYGTPNWEMLSGWLELAPDDDGPFWALNLMKYRAAADYRDGDHDGAPVSGRPITGREADDAYAPLGPLAAVGAMVAFQGDVVAQPCGEPRWDRVAIVRYPTRAAFFAMQQRDDFKRQHVHKEAGMEFTIVLACQPTGFDPTAMGDTLMLTVERAAAPVPVPEGATTLATFDVEGVIVGDDRAFDRARFDLATGDAALAALAASAKEADDAYVVHVARSIDNLVASFDDQR